MSRNLLRSNGCTANAQPQPGRIYDPRSPRAEIALKAKGRGPAPLAFSPRRSAKVSSMSTATLPPTIELKQDKYRRARGGKAVVLEISCSACSNVLMLYQKDGPGALMRSYLNRIHHPPELANLDANPRVQEPSDLSPLRCSHCKQLMGIPMRHTDGRLAFRLLRGSFRRQPFRLEGMNGSHPTSGDR